MATPPDERQALLVAGMHRSGTSAVALAFARLGWSLGADQLETQAEINRDGFGENRGLVAFNEKLLSHFGRHWFQLFELPEGWLDSGDARPFLAEAAALLDDQFDGDQRILLKDPRLCLTLPLWLRVLDDQGFHSRIILQLRDPQAVAASLEKRDSLPAEAGLLLWLHYILSAEHASRDRQRAWLSYEALLERGAAALELFGDVEIPANLDCGIDPSLAHFKPGGAGQHSPLANLCEQVLRDALAGHAPALDPERWLDELDFRSLFNALGGAVTRRSADAVRIGEQHSQALAVIAEKDEALERSAAYAKQCEDVVAEKDAEIAEATRYARECEAVVAEKDGEIAEASRYATECEAAVKDTHSELVAIKQQPIYRLLKALRVLK